MVLATTSCGAPSAKSSTIQQGSIWDTGPSYFCRQKRNMSIRHTILRMISRSRKWQAFHGATPQG